MGMNADRCGCLGEPAVRCEGNAPRFARRNALELAQYASSTIAPLARSARTTRPPELS